MHSSKKRTGKKPSKTKDTKIPPERRKIHNEDAANPAGKNGKANPKSQAKQGKRGRHKGAN